MNRKLYFSIGLLSASIIAFQLALMQILSISQWSHFAYMVISVALLGFGASGTALVFIKNYLIKHIEVSFPALMLLTSASIGLIMLFAGRVFGGFDAYLIFLERSNYFNLIISYMTLSVSFFTGGMAIGLAYVNYVSRVGKLYFADLFGSGLGGLMMLLLLWIFAPATLPFVIALLPLAGGIILIRLKHITKCLFFLIPATAVLIFGFISSPALPMSQYKSLSRTMQLPGARIVDEEISPYGELKLVRASAIRYAPGLSFTFTGQVPVQQVLFNNGNWFGPLVGFGQSDSSHFLDYTTNALPFVISSPETILIPEAGTGLYAAYAISHDAKKIFAVEPNRAAIDLLKRNVSMPSGQVSFIGLNPRNYLMSSGSRYDLIILPTVESFGGSSGINAIQEQYLFTIEAFAEMWKHLTDDGMIAVTVWMDFPVRNSLKMLATLVETAEHLAPENPQNHILAIRSWGTVTFVLKKQPVGTAEIDKLKTFCELRNFDPLLFPGIKASERSQYNQLQDDSFFHMVDQLTSGDREALYAGYDYQIRPATDNKPYFSQFLKIVRLSKMRKIFGESSVPFLEVGYLIVLLTLVQITLAALLLIVIPLFFRGFKGKGKIYSLVHFSGIGVGYMFVEIILIKHFTLFFGHPIYAAAAVLSGMLIFSGLGAFSSGVIVKNKRQLIVIMTAIIVLLIILSVFLTPLLRTCISQPMAVKILLSILAIGPLAFLMGMPFPVGLRILSCKNNNLTPWAWGINGCMSVISTALATIVAVEAGFLYVMLVAALAYSITTTVNLRAVL